ITVRVTNSTPWGLTNLAIYDDSQTYFDGQYIDPYSYADFTFPAVGGQSYTIYAEGNYYYVQNVWDTFTAALDFHQVEVDADGGVDEHDSGNVLCGPDSTG